MVLGKEPADRDLVGRHGGSIDHANERVFVNRTKDQIKDSPEYDDSMQDDESYRSRLGSYYGQGGQGYRDWD